MTEGLWAAEGVIQPSKPSLWIHSWLLPAGLTDGVARASLFLAVMSCCLASAPSGVLQAVVNHYPSRSLYPGASLSSRPAGRTLKALLLVGTLNWSSSILSERIPCKQRGVSFQFFFPFWITTVPKQVCQEKSLRKVWHWCAKSSVKNIFLLKKKSSVVWQHWRKIGHTHQKCALPFEKPWTKWEMIPSTFPAIPVASPAVGDSKERTPLWLSQWEGWSLLVEA